MLNPSAIDSSTVPKPLRVIELSGLFGTRHVRVETAPGPVTLLFGQNGVGKSTILRVVSQMLGAQGSRLASEPVQGASLEFEGGWQMIYRAGPPPTWEEKSPGNESVKKKISGAADDVYFKRWLRLETPYRLLEDGQVKSRNGVVVPKMLLDELLARFRKWQAIRGPYLAASHADERKFARECSLIGSDRLASDASVAVHRPRYLSRHEEPDHDVVRKISADLQESIRDARRISFMNSSRLDSSFMRRAAESLKSHSPSLSESERGDLTREISDLQKRLVDCSLAATRLEIPSFENDSPEVRRILDLYLKDLLEKAKANSLILSKLELFQEILNSHFSDKVAGLEVDTGLTIRRTGTAKDLIPLDRLSSGERHLIVLFYHLIFGTKPGGICLIDEPEISLHVNWQESFISSIERVALVSPQQYLIATHSPSIVGRRYDLMREVLSENATR